MCDTRDTDAHSESLAVYLPLALAGGAPRGAQFALLNTMRNTDIFFMGPKKIPAMNLVNRYVQGYGCLPIQ
tara:strand:- start:152 stop:364 length:213 start_codon:yes stop_codon:yes gene_type:complete